MWIICILMAFSNNCSSTALHLFFTNCPICPWEVKHLPHPGCDCCKCLIFLAWILCVHHLATFTRKAQGGSFFPKITPFAKYISQVLAVFGSTRHTRTWALFSFLARSFPRNRKGFHSPGHVNTVPLANANLQKEDEKQTSCQGSISADRFSVCSPSSCLIQLCFRTKIAKYWREKELLRRIDPLSVHSSSFFSQSQYPCPCPRGENREDRQGRGMVPTRGRLRRSPSPWFSVSSRERSLRPHSRTWKKTTGGHGGTSMPGSPKPHSQNLQHDGFQCWPNKSEGIPSYILFIGRLCSCLLVIPGISYFWCVNFVLHSETTSDLYPVAACGKERCFQYSGYGWKAILPYRGE